MSIYDEVAELTNGYYVPKDNYGQSSNVDKYKKIIEGDDTMQGVYAKIHKFEANENNSYNDYFELYGDWGKVMTKEKTRADIYREHLQTASKDKLIDIAIEGHENYQWANDLAYERGLEIEQLKTEIQSQKDAVSYYNNIAYNSKVACFITICICAVVIGVFYTYQYIKYRLKKYADKIRSETIEEINKSQ